MLTTTPTSLPASTPVIPSHTVTKTDTGPLGDLLCVHCVVGHAAESNSVATGPACFVPALYWDLYRKQTQSITFEFTHCVPL